MIRRVKSSLFFLLVFSFISFCSLSVEAYETNIRRDKNNNIILGKVFNTRQNIEIFTLSKVLIYNHEVSPRSKKNKTSDLRAYSNNEVLGGRRVYTACFGNIDIRNKEGKFIRYIRQNEVFTKEQCEEIFTNYFIFANKELYRMMSKNGYNYYNKLHYLEVPILLDIIWHNGSNGSRQVINSFIEYTKNRNKATLQKVFNSIDNTLKKHSKFDFTGRRENGKQILKYIFNENIWKYK